MDWFRMYGEFATDPKVQMMSEADQRRFIMLLCLRCSNDGVTLHETEIAFQMRITDEQWQATKSLFLSKGLITEDCQPTAWNKRQFVSDSSKARVAAHRAKKKQQRNVTVTPPDTDTDTEETPPPAREDDFDTRVRFAMTADWQPSSKTFQAVLLQMGITQQAFDQDQFLEFRSFWCASPDDHRTQAKWEHALASHLKRNLRQAQAGGNTHGSNTSAGNRPGRQAPMSAVDRVKAAIAEREAREAAAAADGSAVGEDDGTLRPPLDVEFRRIS